MDRKYVILLLAGILMVSSCAPHPSPTPVWMVIDDFSDYPNGVYEIEVSVGEGPESKHFSDSDCPLDIASYSLDMLIEGTGQGRPFGAHLDLHGLGTIRSWYAQIGYIYSPQTGLSYYCQAFSYNSDAERYQRSIGQSAFDSWTNFAIEVVPIDEDWNYAFRFLIDGVQVCSYQPPPAWDGDNRYDVIWRGVEVYPYDENDGQEPIRVLVDNYEGFVSPSCRAPGW